MPCSATPPLASQALAALGLTATATLLASERDLTYRLDPSAVLKICHPDEDAALQLAALRHLEAVAPELPVPRVVTARRVTYPDGLARETYALTWLPGVPLHAHPGGAAQARALGHAMARMARALASLPPPATPPAQLWDISRALDALPKLDGAELTHLALVAPVFARFAVDTLPRLRRLPTQVIHNDFNPHNLFVDAAAPAHLTGIIDFGDLTVAPRVSELAVALSYRLPDPALRATTPDLLAGYEEVSPLTAEEHALLPDLIRTRMAMTVTIASWRARHTPENAAYILRYREGALRCLADPAAFVWTPPTAAPLLARRAAVLSPSYRLFYEVPVHPVRGEGVWLYDADGTRYLDAYNNVVPAGHCHPRVVEAIARQSATLNTHTRYLHEGVVDYAEALLATFPAALNKATFTCTGSEANDLALRIARYVTGGTGIIVTDNAYHGVTAALAEISPSLGEAMPLGAHVRTVPVGGDFAAGVRAAIADLTRHGIKPALLLVDTIFSSDGVYADPPGFLAPAVDAIRAAGGLFLADEVQPGFGRTGAAMWGFMRHGVVPDLVSLGKPMGNGYPVAGLVARAEVIAAFGKNIRYFNTFGGNPVAMAAASATLAVIREERLMANAAAVGAYLAEGLAKHGPLRGAGLFLGLELESGALATRVVNTMRARGVLLSTAGAAGNVLKIRPPLVFAREHADLLLHSLAAALG